MNEKYIPVKTCEITKKDIKMGERSMSRCCPIALAINRAEGINPEVTNWTALVIQDQYEICDEHGKAEYQIKPIDDDAWNTLSDFVVDFDKGKDVEPFEFKYVTVNL